MKRIKTIPFLLAAMFLLGACAIEEQVAGKMPEGEPTLMKLSLTASFRNAAPQSRATKPEPDENKFKNVRVMIFNASGGIVTNYQTTYTTPTDNPTLNVSTLSGNDCSMYIVANIPDAVDSQLGAVQQIAHLNAIEVTAAEYSTGVANSPLLMTGKKENIQIAPGVSSLDLPIQMEYMTAKLTLKVVDQTPTSDRVEVLGWNLENGPQNSFLMLNGGEATRKDANDGKEGDDTAWLTNTAAGVTPFDEIDPTTGTALLSQYLFENRRGTRVDNQPLPPDQYAGMAVGDGDHRGKAWFAPQRATCIVIYALYHSSSASKVVKARIFIGADNHSDYNIERGNNYEFSVTIKGINEIDVDTNLEPINGNFSVETTAPLNQIDAHPDYRPILIKGENGEVSIEILDAQGRSYADPGFDATWAKVSPLDLMYHQVKQAGAEGDWQQVGAVGSFVRPRYIPHKSVRSALAVKGISGWNAIPPGKENDDEMNFADATYRMCYKVSGIPFVSGSVTSKTLYVYTDDYAARESSRTAQVKITFHLNGTPSSVDEVETLTITQNGYLGVYDDTVADAGLLVLNADGTPSTTKKKFGIEQYEEYGLQLYPGIDASVQKIDGMQPGLYDRTGMGTLGITIGEQLRNGYYATIQTVYMPKDITRVNNRPTKFGKTASSLRPKYGNGIEDDRNLPAIPEPYTGSNSGTPYYQPVATNNIYHPIFKSSAARYCHEKNRDLNGDGAIDESEVFWYLPSADEYKIIFLADKTSYFTAYSYSTSYDYYSNKSLEIRLSDFNIEFLGRYSPYVGVRCFREL